MSEEYGNDFITLSDDEGNSFMLEHLDTVELNNEVYMAFLPADIDEGDENYGLVLLKVVEENGEEILTTVDDESELDTAYRLFIERLSDEE